MKRTPVTARDLASGPSLAAVADPLPVDLFRQRRHHMQQGLTVLIVDDDLGFLYWLGCTLSAAGYLPLPALTCDEARTLVARLNIRIDLLVLDSSLPGASELVAVLEPIQRNLKVIAVVTSEEEGRIQLRGADATQFRRPTSDEASETVWLETVRGVTDSNRRDTYRLPPD